MRALVLNDADTKDLAEKVGSLLKAFKEITDFAAATDNYDEGHEYAAKEVAEARRVYREWTSRPSGNK